jgi:hypothetical protein
MSEIIHQQTKHFSVRQPTVSPKVIIKQIQGPENSQWLKRAETENSWLHQPMLLSEIAYQAVLVSIFMIFYLESQRCSDEQPPIRQHNTIVSHSKTVRRPKSRLGDESTNAQLSFADGVTINKVTIRCNYMTQVLPHSWCWPYGFMQQRFGKAGIEGCC